MCYNSQAFLSLLESGKLSLSLQKQRSFFFTYTLFNHDARTLWLSCALCVFVTISLSPHFVCLTLSLSLFLSIILSLSFSLSLFHVECVCKCVFSSSCGTARLCSTLVVGYLSFCSALLSFFLSLSLSLSLFLFLIFASPT
jgi:hypothetical protein